MARVDAAPLIALTHQISREGSCAQARDIAKLKRAALTLVDAHRVPSSLADSFMSGVNALIAETPVCLPPVTTSTPTPAEPAPHDHHGHKKHKEEGD
jgi:hypothetical protein